MTVFANVFLGMQLALSSYLQVCFSITNDVVMSISLMYEKSEAGMSKKTIRPYFFVSMTPRPYVAQASQCAYRSFD